jgi:hypothetical protein
MKLRRRKHRSNRSLRIALRASKRELADHRRWSWMAVMPRETTDGYIESFDPKWGRLYEPLPGKRWV